MKYKYFNDILTIMSKQTEYSNAFINKCELLFKAIRENNPISTCIEKMKDAQSSADPDPGPMNSTTWFEPLWFVYYMFFAIHNPKIEEYINMKQLSSNNNGNEDAHTDAAAHILKNMLRRRANTSTLVFQLYTYANIRKGSVTYIYPAKATATTTATAATTATTPPQQNILKSITSNHLLTAAVVINKIYTDQRVSIETIYNIYIADISKQYSTQILLPRNSSIIKLSNIKYRRKDIILLALVCYMKIDEIDINTKGIFISATKEEITAQQTALNPTSTPTPTSTSTPYDEKYKYLLT